jgi:hypothetical protein
MDFTVFNFHAIQFLIFMQSNLMPFPVAELPLKFLLEEF